MEPITRTELFLAAAAGEFDRDLPDPETRLEYYLKKIANGAAVKPEDIDEAIEAYLNSHDADIVTEQELSDALGDYTTTADMNTALDEKQDILEIDSVPTENSLHPVSSHGVFEALSRKANVADIPDVSSFIDADVDNLANYYDKGVVDDALGEKQNTLTAGDNISIETVNGEVTISATDTTYEDATQQIHGLMSTADKTKLDSITAAKIQAWDAAEQNVNADWSANSGDAQILNKPDLTVYALANDMTTALAGKVDKETGKSLMTADEHTKLNGIETGAQVNTVTGVKGNAENDYRTGDINISPANIGLGNVDNTSDANKPISTATQTALDGKQNVLTFDNAPTENSDNPVKSGGVYSALAGKISASEKGVSGGVAELDENGKIPSSQMPSSVDNILEYPTLNDFPVTGEDRKIYIALDTRLTYRWGGSEYGEISPSIALGTTSSTAYRGDWGAADRMAIGTLTDLQTTAKSDLVSAVNEVKSALGNVQGTLTFDNVPTENSNNPVKSSGIYTALASKQDALTIDSAPTSGSSNPVGSGGVYTALSGKQNTLTFDSTPIENSTNPVTSGGLYSALADKVDAEPNKGLISDSERTKLSGITAGATATSVTQTLSSGTKIGTVTVNGVGTDLYCEANTDTTYSAGTGISISNGEISNSAPNVQADWTTTTGEAVILHKPTLGTAASKDVGTGSNQVAAGNHNHTGVYAPASHSHSYAAVNHNHDGTYAPASHSHTRSEITDLAVATASAAGLMSATDKGKLDGIDKSKLDDSNVGRRVQLYSSSSGTDLVSGALNTGYALTNFTELEIRYKMYVSGSVIYGKTLRATRVGEDSSGSFGTIAAEKYEYSSDSLSLFICGLTVSGSSISLSQRNGAGAFVITQVYGYK